MPVSDVAVPESVAPLVTVKVEPLRAVMEPPVLLRDCAASVLAVPFKVKLVLVVVRPLPDEKPLVVPLMRILSPERLVALVELIVDVPPR